MGTQRMTRVGLVLLTAAVFVAGGACSPAGSGVKTIGSEGGTVSAPSGATVSVPTGALVSTISLSVEKVAGGFPSQASGVTARSDVYALTPHGQTFDSPVTISIPFSAAADAVLVTAPPGGSWTAVPGARQSGGTMVAEVSHFSFFVVVERAPADGGYAGTYSGTMTVNGTAVGTFSMTVDGAGAMTGTITITSDGQTVSLSSGQVTTSGAVTFVLSGKTDSYSGTIEVATGAFSAACTSGCTDSVLFSGTKL